MAELFSGDTARPGISGCVSCLMLLRLPDYLSKDVCFRRLIQGRMCSDATGQSSFVLVTHLGLEALLLLS